MRIYCNTCFIQYTLILKQNLGVTKHKKKNKFGRDTRINLSQVFY